MLENLRERWIDATARRPSGRLGRMFYANPRGHMPSFHLLLRHMDLRPDDYYAEVGCGGGVLLDMALGTVHRAAAVDHSPDMVALASERNAGAIAAGRLEIRQGDGCSLPWDSATFSCIGNANMFFFVTEPVAFLRESLRVLRPGGRLAMATACPSRLTEILWGVYGLRLYPDHEMRAMLAEAGFQDVQVKNRLGMQICLGNKPAAG